MKHHDAHDEIGALLRSQKPGIEIPAGLEGKILRELDRRQRPAPAKRWLWFAMPAAMATALVVLSSKPEIKPAEPNPHVVQQNTGKEEADPATEANPLKRESLALTRDARRAGRFLIDCLPSAGAE